MSLDDSLIEKYNPYDSIREGQKKALDDIFELYDPDAEESVIVELPAPTAFGKSLCCHIGMHILAEEFGEDLVLGTTPLVELVRQYGENPKFDIPCLLGKSNYECALNPEFKANDCIYKNSKKKITNSVCRECEYKKAKAKFDNSSMGWTTFDRFMLDPSIKSRVSCIFVDESAKIESILRKVNSIELPTKFDEKNMDESFRVWGIELENDYNDLCLKSDMLNQEIENGNVEFINDMVKCNREIEKIERKMQVVKKCRYYIENDIQYLVEHSKKEVWDKVAKKKEIVDTKEFKLLTAHIPFAAMINGIKFVVLSSATPATNLLTAKEIHRINTMHPIPIERRPLYFAPVGSMSYNTRNETAKKMGPVIANLHELYNTKTMVHCGSYPVATLIYEELKNHVDEKLILLQTSRNRNEMPKTFRNSVFKSIWLSVEFNEGVDLAGPEYKLNIIAKLPAEPWLAEYTKARNEYDQVNFKFNQWYDTQSACKLMQSYGRICRGPEDRGDTYVLDKAVYSFWNRYKKTLFYPWFNEACIKDGKRLI